VYLDRMRDLSTLTHIAEWNKHWPASVNKATDPGGAGGASAGAEREARPDAPALAVVSDLFFVAASARRAASPACRSSSRETPSSRGVARAVPAARPRRSDRRFDYERLFGALERARPPVLGFTTHALARQTQPWHARCDRVVTKETLTQELPRLLKEGVRE